MVFYLVTNRS